MIFSWSRKPKEKKHVHDFKKVWAVDVKIKRLFANALYADIVTNGVLILYKCECGIERAEKIDIDGTKKVEPEYAKLVKRTGEKL